LSGKRSLTKPGGTLRWLRRGALLIRSKFWVIRSISTGPEICFPVRLP